MVTIVSLWLAILLSGVIVWIVSAVIWTVLPYHKSDFNKLPDEDAALQALKRQSIEPGQYNIPHASARSEMNTPEFRKKLEEGPVGFLTVQSRGIPKMGKSMVLAFIYYLLVGVVVAYVASRTLAPGTEYLTVFRLTGTVSWLAYGAAYFPDAIWFGRPWSAVGKNLFDALIYGLLTAGVFGWLWPKL